MMGNFQTIMQMYLHIIIDYLVVMRCIYISSGEEIEVPRMVESDWEEQFLESRSCTEVVLTRVDEESDEEASINYDGKELEVSGTVVEMKWKMTIQTVFSATVRMRKNLWVAAQVMRKNHPQSVMSIGMYSHRMSVSVPVPLYTLYTDSLLGVIGMIQLRKRLILMKPQETTV